MDVALQRAWFLYLADDRAALTREFYATVVRTARPYETMWATSRERAWSIVDDVIRSDNVARADVGILDTVRRGLASRIDALEHYLPRLVWIAPAGLNDAQFAQYFRSEFAREVAESREYVDRANDLMRWVNDRVLAGAGDFNFVTERRMGRDGLWHVVESHDPYRHGGEIEQGQRRREAIIRRSRSSVFFGGVRSDYLANAERHAIERDDDVISSVSDGME